MENEDLKTQETNSNVTENDSDQSGNPIVTASKTEESSLTPSDEIPTLHLNDLIEMIARDAIPNIVREELDKIKKEEDSHDFTTPPDAQDTEVETEDTKVILPEQKSGNGIGMAFLIVLGIVLTLFFVAKPKTFGTTVTPTQVEAPVVVTPPAVVTPQEQPQDTAPVQDNATKQNGV